jgi:hypothetical protein
MDFVKKFKQENEGDYSAYDAANFVDDNWKEMTGLTNRDKDAEGHFPSEVESFLYELDIDYDDFCQDWGSVREGAEDWEEDDEDEDDED